MYTYVTIRRVLLKQLCFLYKLKRKGKKMKDFSHKPKDASLEYWDILKDHIEDEDIIQQLSVFQRRIMFTRTMIHWEVFRKIQDLPGCIVDCGVYKGESLFNFARFLEMTSPGDRIRKVYGFDDFEGLRDFHEEDTTQDNIGAFEGGYRSKSFEPTLKRLVKLFNEDSFVPKVPRIELVEGDITKTASKFVEDYPGIRFSLIHLDFDLYTPTLAALEAFYPKLVPGGIVLLDEYALNAFSGESKAVEDYFGEKMPKIYKLPWNSTPGGYFFKPSL